MKFDKLVAEITESSSKKTKIIRPNDSSISRRKMEKFIEKINKYIETILDLNVPIQRDIFNKITEAENAPEYQKRMEWLSEGSLLYHTMEKQYGGLNWVHGGQPVERELYTKIVEFLNAE